MNRRAFTLIEVMVALAIGSAVVLMVHQSLAAALDTSERLDAARAAHATEMRARDVLARAFGSLDVSTGGFAGSPHQVAFTTLMNGRREPIRLVVREDVLLLTKGRRSDTLMTAREAHFDYLLSLGSQSSWVQQWHSPASAPVAARLRLRRDSISVDTLLFVIGTRG